MEGTMNITVNNNDEVSVQTRIHHVGPFDKAMLLDAFMNALEIDTNEMTSLLALRDIFITPCVERKRMPVSKDEEEPDGSCEPSEIEWSEEASEDGDSHKITIDINLNK